MNIIYNFRIVLLLILSIFFISTSYSSTLESIKGINLDINNLNFNTPKSYAKFSIDSSLCNENINDGENTLNNSCSYSTENIKYTIYKDEGFYFKFINKLKPNYIINTSSNIKIISKTNDSIILKCIDNDKLCEGFFTIYGDLNYRVTTSKSVAKNVKIFEDSIATISLKQFKLAYYDFLDIIRSKNKKNVDFYILPIKEKYNSLEEEFNININERRLKAYEDNNFNLSSSKELLNDLFNLYTSNTNSDFLVISNNTSNYQDNITNSTYVDLTSKLNTKVSILKSTNFNSPLAPSTCLNNETPNEWDGSKWLCKPKYYAFGTIDFKTNKIISSESNTFNISKIQKYGDYFRVTLVRPVSRDYMVFTSPIIKSDSKYKTYDSNCFIRYLNLYSFEVHPAQPRSYDIDMQCNFKVIADSYYK